jgi:hypothetical protein
MNIKTKKKIAREILLLFAALGVTLLIGLFVWCYSLVIDGKIQSKDTLIKQHSNELSDNFKIYNDKISKIKTFVGKLKAKEDEHWGSSFSLYLFSKEMKVEKAVRKYEVEQAINGQLPSPDDTLTYYKCIQSFKSIKPPSGFILDFNDKDALSVWNCLVADRANLFYFLPMSFLEEYEIETRPELYKLIDQYSLSSDEIKIAAKKDSINNQIARLQNERAALSTKTINRQSLTRIVLTAFIVILILIYPVRLLVLAFRWAFKTYKQPL